MLTQLDAPPHQAKLDRVAASGAPQRVTRELHFEFVGANPAAGVNGLDELPGKASYFLGQNPAQWRTSVPLFGRVRVAQIYPGVDLIYYGNEQRLEYDFVIAPRFDPGRISIHFTGADKIQISPEGELVFTLGRETIRQPKPLVYQTVSGVRKQIAGSYRLDSRQTVAFRLGDYDHELPLVWRIVERMKESPCIMVGDTQVSQLAALYERALVVVGPDSGPLHLAAAVGAPTVTLFGPADPVEFGPWGAPNKHIVLASPIGCRPCRVLNWGGDNPEFHPCMRDITTGQVLEAVRRVAHSS